MAVLRYDFIGNNSSLTTAIKQSVASLSTLEQAANKSNQAIKNEIAPLSALRAELTLLNKQKLNIVDIGQLAKQNALIQELEAEIARFGNAGKIGFDSLGNAIEKGKSGLEGVGKSLTSGLGLLRQVAYILPGIGIAGIFNLAFEAIGKVSEGLGLFNDKLTLSQNNLKNLNDVAKDASKQYGEQSTNLRILYAAATDVNNAEHDRVLAARELQKEFPDTFKNIQLETILNGDASASYKTLTEDILANAKAKAAASKIAELSAKQLQADFKEQKIRNAEANESAKAQPLKQTTTGGNSQLDAVNGFTSAKQQQQSIIDQRKVIHDRAVNSIAIEEQNKKDLQDQIDFLVKFAGGNNKIAKALSTNDTPTLKSRVGGENLFSSISSALDDIFNKTNSLANQSGLLGYSLEVQKVTDKYIALNKQIDDNVAKAVQSNGRKGGISDKELGIINDKADRDRQDAQRAKEKELSDLKIEESQRVSNEIQRINDEFGVKSEQSRAKEFASITKLYDQEVVKAKGNAELIAAADNGRLVAVQAVNDKYLQIQQDLQGKILQINNLTTATLTSREETETARIEDEWEKRRVALNGYYNDLLKIVNSLPNIVPGFAGNIDINGIIANAIQNKQENDNQQITDAKNKAIEIQKDKPFTDALQQGVRSFGNSFLNTITTINQESDRSFKAIFSNLTSSLTGSLNKIFTGTLETLLSSAIKNAISKGINSLFSGGKLTLAGGLAAGGVLAGGIISGATSKTSATGQGIGGALSGAGTGAAIGSLLGPAGTIGGAIIGGAVGLLSGIFGASKAQKELQAQQLEQQKEQTNLLKQSLAYTSNIIGRMTSSGVITDINVGSTGQLTATVNGKDLQFVLDRYRNGR